MKKRKTFIGMVFVIAILVLGIGYAAIADIPLLLNGTANVQANAEFRVEYDTSHTIKVSPSETQMTWDDGDLRDVVTGQYDTNDKTVATMTVNLDSTNRSASAIYKIDNLSQELKAILTTEVTADFLGTNADYLQATSELFSDENCTMTLGDTVLEATKSAYLKVTVSLKKLPVEAIENAVFTITTTAEPVAVELN